MPKNIVEFINGLSEEVDFIIIDGYMGVGKSSFAKNLRCELGNISPFFIIHLDDYLIESKKGGYNIDGKCLHENIRFLLSKNQKVIFDGLCALDYVKDFVSEKSIYIRISREIVFPGVVDKQIIDVGMLSGMEDEGSPLDKKQFNYYSKFNPDSYVGLTYYYWVVIMGKDSDITDFRDLEIRKYENEEYYKYIGYSS